MPKRKINQHTAIANQPAKGGSSKTKTTISKHAHTYIKVSLVTEQGLDMIQLKTCISLTVRQNYGLYGSSFQTDILKYDQIASIAFLRVWGGGDIASLVLASLALCTTYAGQPVQFRVLGVSPFLVCLA